VTRYGPVATDTDYHWSCGRTKPVCPAKGQPSDKWLRNLFSLHFRLPTVWANRNYIVLCDIET